MIEFLTKLSGLLIFITAICYCYQIVYLFIPFVVKKRYKKPLQKNKYAILIAARNEEAVLPHLLDSINAQDYPAELVDTFVVADNCTDNTAQVAREHGATVFTRFNKARVGKGYALNYLLDQIKRNFDINQYDAFLIFDADNLLRPDYITKMNHMPSEGYQAFCGYRNTKNFGTNWITSSYALWYLHESSHMNRSRDAIHSCASVNGTGFGFTRELLERLGGWNFFTLTEDIEFNNWCASHGVRIGYCQEAMLYDEQPLTFRQSWRQRTRWAQGGYQVSVKYVKDLAHGLFKGGWCSYACYELMTLSLWGFGFSTLVGLLALVTTLLFAGSGGFFFGLVFTFVCTYLSMFAMGGWTLLTEWKKILATPWQKIRSLFLFPFFIMTFAPITITALFRKFDWSPIEHTVAISAKQLQKNS